MSSSVSARMKYYPPPAGSPPQGSTPPSGVHLTRDADYLIESFLPASASPSPYEISKLPLPYCAPQLTPGFDAPFCRAHNPILESLDITQGQLLSSSTASAAIQVGSKTGMRVLSKTLTDRYLRTANLRLFKPRRLSCRHAAPHPDGKHDRARRGGQAAPGSRDESGTVRSKKVLAAQRRAAALEGYALPLDFDMPKAAKAQDAGLGGLRGRLAGGGGIVAVKEMIVTMTGEPAVTTGDLAEEALALAVCVILSGRYDDRGAGRYGDQGAGAQPDGLLSLVSQTGIGSRVIGRLNGGGARSFNPRRSPIELQVANADLVEHWQSSKVLWLVVMNSNTDDEIELIEMVESQNDKERIDERTWQAEMTVEKEDLKFDAEVQRVAREEARLVGGRAAPIHAT
ncbi:hypothetical protein K438DRAFT_1942061 [Mycena galopus ATCC 62051]|nr:hypothetical protein K438DRAFT_1942061 [Mycena galopus ATCC 62051]